MKVHGLKLALLTAILISASGCATSGYWVDRGRDAADIFTLAVGVGAGAKVRLGPIQAGLLLQNDLVGLRGGTIGTVVFDEENRDPWYKSYATDVQCLIAGGENFDPGWHIPILRKRRKQYMVDNIFPLYLSFRNGYTNADNRDQSLAPYYTQIELVAALGPGIRFGFNPGELLDFFLGFFGKDIYGDDLERRKKKKSATEQEKVDPEGSAP